MINTKTVELINDFYNNNIITDDDYLPFMNAYTEKSYHSDNQPRILLAGEFKSGKSTILNALLGGEYSAVDVLEMTSWIARYWSSESPFCKINYVDDSYQLITIQEFVSKCKTKEITLTDKSISRIDIGVMNEDLSYCIIDSPGYGSITKANEKKMISAIGDADLIAFVFDVDCLGGVREAGVVGKLLKHGIPYIFILSKCDLLHAYERTEIVNYLVETYHINEDDIFLVSGKNAFEELSNGLKITDETGMPKLNGYFNKLKPQLNEIRIKSRDTHANLLNEHAVNILNTILEEAVKLKESILKFESILNSVLVAVQTQIELDIEKLVRNSLLSTVKNESIADLNIRLSACNGALSDNAIADIFNNHLGPDFLSNLWQNIYSKLIDTAAPLWADKIIDFQVQIDQVCSSIRRDAINSSSISYSSDGFSSQTESVSDETYNTAMTTSFSIAGIASIAAFSVTQLSFFAAITGIGLPIAGLGAIVSSVLAASHKNDVNYVPRAELMYDMYTNYFINEVLVNDINLKIRDLNNYIKNAIYTDYVKSVNNLLPNTPLDLAIYDIKTAIDTLQSSKLIN